MPNQRSKDLESQWTEDSSPSPWVLYHYPIWYRRTRESFVFWEGTSDPNLAFAEPHRSHSTPARARGVESLASRWAPKTCIEVPPDEMSTPRGDVDSEVCSTCTKSLPHCKFYAQGKCTKTNNRCKWCHCNSGSVNAAYSSRPRAERPKTKPADHFKSFLLFCHQTQVASLKQLASMMRVRFSYPHEDAIPLLVEVLVGFTGAWCFTVTGCYLALGFIRPFYAAAGRHHAWLAISAALDELVEKRGKQHIMDDDFRARVPSIAPTFDPRCVAVAEKMWINYRISKTKDFQLVLPRIPVPMSIWPVIDNIGWAIALRQLSRYWARKIPESNFPLRGWVKKYSRFLIELANSMLENDGVQSDWSS